MGRKRGPDSGVAGCLVIDKPAGYTSHDVINIVRKALGTRKVGHAGTLDPDATGVLVLGVGVGTKLLEFVVGVDKSYECEIVFGVETSTLDSSGDVTANHNMSFTLDEASQAAEKLTGDIEQIPPMVSAIKIDGKRLHELARQGIEVERKSRPVTVSKFDVSATDNPLVYSASIDCSSGTYVRTLGADLGHLLGGGAHIQNLRRTRVGPFDLTSSVQLADVSEESLRSVKDLLIDMPIIQVDGEVERKVMNGQSLGQAPGPGRVAICDVAGSLLAVYETKDKHFKPLKVLPH